MMHFRLVLSLILLTLISGCGITLPSTQSKPELKKVEKKPAKTTRVIVESLSSTSSLSGTSIKPEKAQPLNVLAIIPLTGRYQSAGENIQKGLIQSYYEFLQKHSLLFLDSNTLTQDALNTFIEQNAINAVVGPLTKSNIQALKIPDKIIQLSLNNHPSNPSLSLSINNDFKHLTERAQLYHSSALILHEQTADAQTHSSTAREILNQAKIQTVDSGFLPIEPDRQPQYLEHFLRIQQSRERIENLQRFIRVRTESQEQMRTDASVIFINIPSRAAQQLQPFKKYVHNNELSLYSTSSILDKNAENNKDLNGVFVAASAAQVNKENALKALGFDAWSLITQMPNGSFSQQGKIGDYTYNHPILEQSLRTYRFKNGKLVWQK